MTSLTGPSIIDAQLSLATVRRARETDLTALRRRLDDGLSQARTFRDPDLTDEANARRRTEMERAARERAGTELDGIERTTNAAAEQIRAYAERTSAPTTRDATEQLLAETRQGRAWDRTRALLDAGRSAADVIGSADVDTLRALRVELPSYLAGRRAKPEGLAGLDWTEADQAPVLRTIDRALVDRLPKDQSAALRIRLDLDQAEPGLRETVAGLRRQVDGSADGGDGLRSAIAARFADQEAAQLDA
ncbi:hypothetical protein ACFVX6_19680 [Streptomyces sp. NPDC058289]|uniref:hypothetical protein n=1 Tax=Streptomyces sp. NPDC058289 TaxID=3346425 RepID=UPI0036EA8E85